MREICRVYIGETGYEANPIPRPQVHEDMNQPFQMVQCTPTIPHTPYVSIQSAVFEDSDVRTLNTTMVEGPSASSCTPSLRTDVCVLPEYQAASRYDTSFILSANLCSSGIHNKNSILHKNQVIKNT